MRFHVPTLLFPSLFLPRVTALLVRGSLVGLNVCPILQATRLYSNTKRYGSLVAFLAGAHPNCALESWHQVNEAWPVWIVSTRQVFDLLKGALCIDQASIEEVEATLSKLEVAGVAAGDWSLVSSLELPSFRERSMPWAGAPSKGQGGQATRYLHY